MSYPSWQLSQHCLSPPVILPAMLAHAAAQHAPARGTESASGGGLNSLTMLVGVQVPTADPNE